MMQNNNISSVCVRPMWHPPAATVTRERERSRRIFRSFYAFCILATITMSIAAQGSAVSRTHHRRRRHSHFSEEGDGGGAGGGGRGGYGDWDSVSGLGERGREPLYYVGYGGDPWGSSSSADHPRPLPLSSTLSTATNDTSSTQISSVDRAGSSRRRSKRGVVHLYNMVVCATGCNPLAYKGYGCYCGFLGSGYTIDGIDQCCKMHDWCYEAADCPMFLEYFIPYYWKCYRGHKPICAIEHGDWGGAGSCAQRLCECDRALAECLRRYPCPTTKAVCTSSPWRLVQNLFMIL